MERVDIKIGFQCNNRCKFCVQGDKRDFCIFKNREEVEKAMNEAYQQGKREVVFTGGEPTLHPNFLELVSSAKNKGFNEIQIQTNGRLFAYDNFCLKTIQAGANQFGPALHGPNAKIHDFLTGAQGSFNQTIQGIKNLKKLNQYVLTNTVITTKNYKFLPQIARLLIDLGVDQYQFAFIHLGGRAGENKDWIAPRKSEVMKYVKKGLDIGIKVNKKVMTEAIPYCLMQGYEDYIAERVIPDSVVYDAGFVVEDYAQYRREKGKAKGPNCEKCKYNQICEGPWKEYPELFGWGEFKPII